LSVDIDLTYLPLNTREEALADISKALQSAADETRRVLNATVVEQKLPGTDHVVKLQVRRDGATIKVEPNIVLRGTIHKPVQAALCKKAETEFELSTTVLIAAPSDLYGGKICAALDRQHPRDLFDIKFLLDNEGLTDEIRKAFVVYLSSHDRPMHELLNFKLKEIRPAFENEFKGMTTEPVELNVLLETRQRLMSDIRNSLSKNEKNFLVSLNEGEPIWDLLELPGFEKLPAIKWKLENIRKMDASKRAVHVDLLKRVLGF